MTMHFVSSSNIRITAHRGNAMQGYGQIRKNSEV